VRCGLGSWFNRFETNMAYSHGTNRPSCGLGLIPISHFFWITLKAESKKLIDRLIFWNGTSDCSSTWPSLLKSTNPETKVSLSYRTRKWIKPKTKSASLIPENPMMFIWCFLGEKRRNQDRRKNYGNKNRGAIKTEGIRNQETIRPEEINTDMSSIPVIDQPNIERNT
jgi:hypothetical protein